MTDPVSLATP
jgi:hypothetical protein